MKLKPIIGASLLTIVFIALGFINISNDNTVECSVEETITKKSDEVEIWHGVQNRFRNGIFIEKVLEAKKLDDMIDYYPKNWILKYDSVQITVFNKEEVFSAVGKNNVLTKTQKKNLRSVEYSSRIEINVFFKEENSATRKLESSQMRRTFTIVPKTSAKFVEGEEKMIGFLKSKTKDKLDLSKVKTIILGPDSVDYPGRVSVLFVVNEEGKIENVRMNNISGIENTDKILMSAITQMPLWIPAKNKLGVAVKQEFEFTVTQSKFGWGC